VTNVLYGTRLTDMETGDKVFTRAAVADIGSLVSTSWKTT